jgi:hypothetical protein
VPHKDTHKSATLPIQHVEPRVFVIERRFPKKCVEAFCLVHIGKDLLMMIFINRLTFKMKGHTSPEGDIILVRLFHIRRVLDEVFLQDELWEPDNRPILGWVSSLHPMTRFFHFLMHFYLEGLVVHVCWDSNQHQVL